jgi:hypothetical protein
MCLISKNNDMASKPIHNIQYQLMEMPIIHGFDPKRHLVHYDCAICKKPGDHHFEKLRLVHGIEAT